MVSWSWFFEYIQWYLLITNTSLIHRCGGAFTHVGAPRTGSRYPCYFSSPNSVCTAIFFTFPIKRCLDIVYFTLFNTKKSFKTLQKGLLINRISGATNSAVVATSITATFIICRHIYATTSHDRRTRRRYKHIVDILIQSSILYTTAVLADIVLQFVNTGTLQNSIKLEILLNYFEIFPIVTSVSVASPCNTYLPSFSFETCCVIRSWPQRSWWLD